MAIFILSGFGLYLLFILLLLYGWEKAAAVQIPEGKLITGFSIVIPLRNEEANVEELIINLRNLNYPNDSFEIIFVDDHSTDRTAEKISSLISGISNYQFLSLPDSLHGKKQAITFGARKASHEVIATTDADCSVPEEWLKILNRYFSQEQTKMTAGPVAIKSIGFFAGLQAMEFSSLIGSAAATLALNQPTMANAANIAFRKQTFFDVNGFEGSFHIPSGDDEVMLRKISSAFPGSVQFLNDPKGLVITKPMKSLSGFFSQRMRWAGKWTLNPSWGTRLIAVFVFLIQLIIIASFVLVLSGSEADLLIMLLLAKAAMEGIFLWRVNSFLRLPFRFLHFVVLQFLYPVYVVSVPLFSALLKNSWKGRR